MNLGLVRREGEASAEWPLLVFAVALPQTHAS